MDTNFAAADLLTDTAISGHHTATNALQQGKDLSSEKASLPVSRFGINDLWKIRQGKRYANVYPRRVG